MKFNRAIQGATLESILQKRNQKPEVRKAQREQAIRCGGDNKYYLLIQEINGGALFLSLLQSGKRKSSC